MRHLKSVAWSVLGLSLLLIPCNAQALYLDGQPDRTAVHAERVPGVLIVNFKAEALPASIKAMQRGGASVRSAAMGIASVDALNAKYDLREYRALFPGAKAPTPPTNATDLRGYQVLTLDPTVDLDEAAAEYLSDPNVESVEYDYYAYIMRTPNDPTYSLMWGLNQSQDHDIDAPEAWDKTAGSPTVILADTDTGVLYTHPDLIDNIWVNPGEDFNGNGEVFDPWDLNGVDDDSNGYVDDLIGWDFVSAGTAVWPGEDGIDQDNDPIDFHGHGTHTSGTMAATMNNAVGVASVAGGFGPSEPGCKIMCLRMGYSFNDGGSENGRTHMNYVAEAFYYAANNGATAINYSFGSSTGGGIEAATDYAVAHGVIIAASAGNSNNMGVGYLQGRPDVINVASTTSLDRKSSFSNYGPFVDVSAPGSSIRSTVSSHYTAGYATWSGTSMAAPHVAGLAGLIKSLNPLLTRQEIFDRIINTTDDIDGLNPSYVGMLGSGRINANNALTNIASTDFDASPRIGAAPLTVQFQDNSQTTPTGWTWDFGDGQQSNDQNPQHTFAPGVYDVSLTIDTDIGNGVKTEIRYIAALAETLTAADSSGLAGETVRIDILAHNNLPVDTIVLPIICSNISAVGFLDSVVTTGCRTDHMVLQPVFDDKFNGKIGYRMSVNDFANAMPPGDGPIAKAYIRLKQTAQPGDSIDVGFGTLGVWSLKFTTAEISYEPAVNVGLVSVAALIGDLNVDGVYDAADMNSLIDILFFNAPMPNPQGIADTNCDGFVDAVDLNNLINFLFFSGPAPCE
ncbi:MAG: hypothetical protein Kow0074_08130 [Candidatus Zixiibacteriota bacterium]